MLTNIPKEAMKYKQALFNPEIELLTKLRIIRLVKAGYSQQQVAGKFGCHRNTVSKLIKQFQTQLGKDVQTRLVNDTQLSLDMINQLMAPLKSKPSRPYHHPKQPDIFLSYLVLWLHQDLKWRVGYRMMYHLIQRSFYDAVDPYLKQLTQLTPRQLRTIYQNFNLKVKKVRTHNGQVTPLYDYTALAAFEYLHLDVKILADQHSLPKPVYHTLISHHVPKYQWTLIDAKTRVRFVAYSYNINAEFGLKFLLWVISFIRVVFSYWQIEIIIGIDNGSEFCQGSETKLSVWNEILKPLKASVYQYHPYFDVRKNLIERSHLMDDRYFLVPRGHLLTNETIFMKEVTHFFQWYNFDKPHTGRNMNGKTPYQVLTETRILFPERLLTFPVLLLDKQINLIREVVDPLLFQAELRQKQALASKPLTPKQVINLARKYKINYDDAQKVLTQYVFNFFF